MRFWEWLKGLFATPSQSGGRPSATQPVPPPARPPQAPAIALRPLPDDLLQFPAGRMQQSTELVVGLDFGTSSCKVAVQSPYKLGGRAVFVPFGDVAHAISPHFIPATLWAGPTGQLSLRPEPHGWQAHRHLKLGLMDDDAPDDGQLRLAMGYAAAYLALVLRESRRFFLLTQRDSYGADELRWSLNLGIPSAGYDDDRIRRRFETVAQAAWRMSLVAQLPTKEASLAALDVQGEVLGLLEVGVVPEVAAQVVGYARSLQHRQGLHVLLDVGASTLDLCAFILHQPEGEDHYNLLTADVRPLGLLELHRRRREATGGQPPFHQIPADLVAPMPDWPAGIDGKELPSCDLDFVEATRKVLMGTLIDLKTRRYPLSPCWQGRLPLFVCGGGARSTVIGRSIRRASESARDAWGDFKGLEELQLPLPAGVSTGDPGGSAASLRLSVAYGLSVPEINIGTIRPPWEIEDAPVEQRPPHWQEKYVSKDQV